MSSRFHNKWHRHNHHTNPTVGEPDSSHDPIASPDDPFQGDFVVNGTVSSHNVITTNLTASNIESDTILADDLTANNIYTTFLSAASSIVNVLDIFITETSGFTVTGTSTDAHVPESVIPGSNLFLLDGVGLSSTNWASFEGDLQVGGCVLTDCISSYTPTATAINVWNNLDLHGHSISGIANDSLTFESGAKVQSDTLKRIKLDAFSFAENTDCSALSASSHAEGYASIASGLGAHAEGGSTTASGYTSHAEGRGTTASGENSHAEGYGTTASGQNSHAEGDGTIASGYTSHAEGRGTTASGYVSHAEGDDTTASGGYSHAEGFGTTASEGYSHAEGYRTTAFGQLSHAEGDVTIASGYASHAEGRATTASEYASHAEGYRTTASGGYSHAEGLDTTASGQSSHAEGDHTTASGENSHAAGTKSVAVQKNTWIWSSHSQPVSTTQSGQFMVCADGGIVLGGDTLLNNVTAENITTSQISVDAITAYTPTATAINVWNNLDLHGHSIISGNGFYNTVSSHNVITTNLTASNIESDTILAGDLTANNIYTTFLSADSIQVPSYHNDNWDGTYTTVAANSANWNGTNIPTSCVLTDCISSLSLNQTAINVWNNLDLHGHSISGIANDSLTFESGAKVQSDTDKIIIPNILSVSGNGFYNEVYEQYGYNNLIITPEDQFDWELINGDTEARVIRYKGLESSDVVVVIPHTYNGVPVTELSVGHIKDGAFYNKNIKSVYAPKSLKTVNSDLNEHELSEFGDGEGEGGAFYQCKLEFASLPAATSIGNYAFYHCPNLKSVSLPAAPSIGSYAFGDCTTLQNVSLPAVTSVGDWAFEYCRTLQSVSLPAATSIGEHVFDECDALQSVSLPAATSIGDWAFAYCTALQSVSLPVATSIGNWAFTICTALQSVLWGGNAPSVGAGIYSDIGTTVTNYVLEGTTGWGSTLGNQPVVVVPNFENLHTDDTFVNGDLTVTGLISTSNLIVENLTADNIYTTFLSAASSIFKGDLQVDGCVLTDCISSYTPTATAINVWNNLDMHNYSICGIGSSSLTFADGAKIGSSDVSSWNNAFTIVSANSANWNSYNVDAHYISTSGIIALNPTMGSEIAINMTGDTTLTFTLSDYPDNKVSTIGVALSTNSFNVSADLETIDETAWNTLSISNTSWNDIIFRKGYGAVKFVGH